jgi:peptide/nickel transport system substrate-binding protein
MRRRQMMAGMAAGLAAPSVVGAQGAQILRFVPSVDLTVTDPIYGTSFTTRNHAAMVFDTLYGVDEQMRAHPQMAAGHVVENDGLTWRITLRDGLRFHDGEPVLARDCIASLQRWGRRDTFGSTLFATTNEVVAESDKVIVWRLKRPFRMLPDALGKMLTNVPVIMPERLAQTDPYKPAPEIIGSGPYRFLAAEHNLGHRAAYAKFDRYVPRPDGPPSAFAGPKLAHFDRVEWMTMPDPSTAAAALAKGEIDWWLSPTSDHIPSLRRNAALKVDVIDPYGSVGMIRFNFLHAPFSDPAVRRAALAATRQSDVMSAMIGTDSSFWRLPAGFFTPGSPMASDAGMEALRDPPDLERARQMLKASSYNGEKLVLLVEATAQVIANQGAVMADAFAKIGFNVDYQSLDTAAADQRIRNKGPTAQGGWSAYSNTTTGLAASNPAAHGFIRGHGEQAIWGWPTLPRLEELRNAWFDAPDEAAQKEICRQIQLHAFETVPYVPTGVYVSPTAYRANLVDMRRGIAQFYGVRRA